MKRSIYRDKVVRSLSHKYEKKKCIYLYLTKSDRLSWILKYSVAANLSKLSSYRYTTRIRNRCIVTGRGRGVLSHFKISRHSFKRFVNAGLLAGIYKGS